MDIKLPPSSLTKIIAGLLLFLYFFAAFDSLINFGVGIGSGLFDSIN